MAIEFKQDICTNETLTDFAAVREGILAAAKEAEEAGRHDKLLVEIEGGWYYLNKPFRLSAVENPELASVDITIRGKGGDSPKMHSLNRIELSSFERVEGKPYLKYQLSKDQTGNYPKFHNLFLNANAIPMSKTAIWRNPDHLTAEERTGAVSREGFYIPMDTAKALSDALGAAELTIFVEWEYAKIHVARLDFSKTQTVGGAVYVLAVIAEDDMKFFSENCHRILDIFNREAYIENAPAALTEPNTFAYDYHSGILYVLPKNTEDLRGQFVQYPSAENFFSFEGLSNLTLENIVFTASTVKHLCDRIYHSGQANCVKKEGRPLTSAVLASNMRNFRVSACEFIDLGGNALHLINATTGARVENCLFRNVGMSALLVGNSTTKWEDPVNRNYNVFIENNRFEKIGYEYPTSVCIYIGMADNLRIRHNSIKNCAYSAISAGWGWLPVSYVPGESCNIRGAEIAYNYFENFMDVLRDGGAIYVLGGNADPSACPDCFNFIHDNYAELEDARDGSKYGYYCDGATTNWEVRHNVIINCLTPLYSQHHPGALSYHNHFIDNYSTTHNRSEFHSPGRDVYFYDCHVVEEGYEALAKAFPVVEEIKKNAGCSLKY